MKLFKKNEITFSVVLILIYVFGESAMLRVSEKIGVEFLAEMIFCIIMSVIVFLFIRRNSLEQYLGLKKSEISASKMLFYIPLLLIGGVSAFFGLGMKYSLTVAVIHTVMMICVGFLEEVIFRGFLFRGIAKQNITRAVIISSVTFGIGHFVNLLNGYNLLENITQVIYAVSVGFLLVFIFLRTCSIIPCIVFHGFNNSMSAFATGNLLIDKFGEESADIIASSIRIVMTVVYLIYIIKLPKKDLLPKEN
ncbi:MAG: CPBP family intramembrane metalloprotease [Ruminococcus sp.]|nr:CPBP family intramembrane metalloprotease [Ruminococcus sp.]